MRLFEFPMEEKMKIRLNSIRSLFLLRVPKIVDVLFYRQKLKIIEDLVGGLLGLG